MNAPLRRIHSIDVVRGAIMILMVLDHARFYFTQSQPEPEVIAHRDAALFLTRWLTHFCAPGFFFLAGISASLHLNKPERTGGHVLYLVKRGLLLILLELTIVGYAWFLAPGANFGGVLWALGWSFVALALALRLGHQRIGMAGLLIVSCHHLLDGLKATEFGPTGWVYGLLHVRGAVQLPLFGEWYVLYPLVPWIGVMMLGYAAAPVFMLPSKQRRTGLVSAGIILVAVFLLLRITGVYGQPLQSSIAGVAPGFEVQETWLATLVSLLNTEKYPASLQYLSMTLGPVLVALGLLARLDRLDKTPQPLSWLALVGTVPLFFYVVHLYLLRFMALVVALVAGQPADWLWLNGSNLRPPDYGYGLGVIYLSFFAASALLIPLCHSWSKFRGCYDNTRSYHASALNSPLIRYHKID